MGDYALYKVLHTYVPRGNEEYTLCVQKDDILEIPVQSPISKSKYPQLYAYNRRTGERGYVPVAIVKLLGSKVNNTIHHPSAVGVEVSALTSNYKLMQVSEPEIKQDVHRLKDFFAVSPILCIHCTDYIWGIGIAGNVCSGEIFFNTFDSYLKN